MYLVAKGLLLVEQPSQIFPEPLGFGLKLALALHFRQHSHLFAHTPPGSAENLEALDAGNEERNAVVADGGHALRVAVKGLKFESGEVDALELFGGIHRICNL